MMPCYAMIFRHHAAITLLFSIITPLTLRLRPLLMPLFCHYGDMPLLFGRRHCYDDCHLRFCHYAMPRLLLFFTRFMMRHILMLALFIIGAIMPPRALYARCRHDDAYASFIFAII
jgi:hypothetical protein